MNIAYKCFAIGIPASIAAISVSWAMKKHKEGKTKGINASTALTESKKKPLDIKRCKQANPDEFNTCKEVTEFKKKMLDLLDSELSCCICYEVFVEPVRLPCLHAFCEACVLQNEENQTKCPLCRATYTVGRKDTLLAGCIQNIIESAYNPNEMTKRDELVAARKDLKSLMMERKKKKWKTKILKGVDFLADLFVVCVLCDSNRRFWDPVFELFE